MRNSDALGRTIETWRRQFIHSLLLLLSSLSHHKPPRSKAMRPFFQVVHHQQLLNAWPSSDIEPHPSPRGYTEPVVFTLGYITQKSGECKKDDKTGEFMEILANPLSPLTSPPHRSLHSLLARPVIHASRFIHFFVDYVRTYFQIYEQNVPPSHLSRSFS